MSFLHKSSDTIPDLDTSGKLVGLTSHQHSLSKQLAPPHWACLCLKHTAFVCAEHSAFGTRKDVRPTHSFFKVSFSCTITQAMSRGILPLLSG